MAVMGPVDLNLLPALDALLTEGSVTVRPAVSA